MDLSGEIAAHRDFGAFDAIHAGITAGTGARNGNFKSRHQTQVHKVLGQGRREFHFFDDGALANLELAQGAAMLLALAFARLLAPEDEVENHFQFQLYFKPTLETGNDQSHTYL
jgi:hypothetical protein